MSKKPVQFKTVNSTPAPDTWVAQREAAPAAVSEPTKRLTVDIPQSLHKRIRLACVERDEVMADVIRQLLQNAFSEAESS